MGKNLLIILGCILIVVILILLLTFNNTKKRKGKKSKNKINVILIFILVTVLIGINIFIRNINSNDVVELYLEDNEVLYEKYIYTLPDGWRVDYNFKGGLNIIFNSTNDGIPYYNGGVVNVQKMTAMKYGESVFNDMSFFENALKKNHTGLNIGEGRMFKNNQNDVIVFPCEYKEHGDIKFLFAFMKVDETDFYNIQFYSNVVIDNVDEMRFNYNDLYAFVDFLNNNKEKEDDRIFRTHNASLKKDNGSLKVFEKSTDEE